LTAGADKKDVEIVVSKWLTGARDRDGRREKRRSKTANDRENEDEGSNINQSDNITMMLITKLIFRMKAATSDGRQLL
jgi:hypothetical protein